MRLVAESDGLPREFTPELALRRAITMLVADGTQTTWAWLGRDGHRLGAAGVCRVRPGRTLHVVGSTALAERMRDLLAAGAQPGWRLHPVPSGSTPLEQVLAPLARRTGNNRFYNLLDRAGFRTVEEVAATPDEALLAIRNVGRRLVDTLREILRDLPAADGAPPVTGVPDEAGARHLRMLLGLLPSRSDRAFWTALAAHRGLDPDELARTLRGTTSHPAADRQTAARVGRAADDLGARLAGESAGWPTGEADDRAADEAAVRPADGSGRWQAGGPGGRTVDHQTARLADDSCEWQPAGPGDGPAGQPGALVANEPGWQTGEQGGRASGEPGDRLAGESDGWRPGAPGVVGGSGAAGSWADEVAGAGGRRADGVRVRAAGSRVEDGTGWQAAACADGELRAEWVWAAAELCLSAFDGDDAVVHELLDRVVGYRAPRGVAGRRWARDAVETAWRLYLPLAAARRTAEPDGPERAEVG